MKSVLSLFLFLFAIAYAFSQENNPILKVDSIFKFGQIDKNSEGIGNLKFYNTGKSPLIITNITSTCGCTVPSWPKEPVLPGDSGLVQVKYDTRRVGTINKQITIASNACDTNVIVRISGNVLEIPDNIMPRKIIDNSGMPVNR